MPRGEVYYRPGVPSNVLDDLQNVLPSYMAHAMSTQAVPLKREDIELRFIEAGPRDKTLVDIAITIIAGHSEERAQDKESRRARLERDVQLFIPKRLSFSTWVLLEESAYSEVPAQPA